MALIILQDIEQYGFSVLYSDHPPENLKLNASGCFSIDGYKNLESMIEDIRKKDLVVDLNDQFILYGINKDGILIVMQPLGCYSGEDFLETS